MLTRDIYRDFYKDSGPTFGERLFVASKRICILFAGAALTLGVLDIFGVHSIVGATAALHDAPARLANIGESLRNGIGSISLRAPTMESIRVAIPSQSAIRFSTKTEPSVIDELVAVRKQDAVQMAMMTAQPTFMAAPVIPPATAKPDPIVTATVEKPEPKAAPVTLAALAPVMPKEQVSTPPVTVKPDAFAAQASSQVQLASLSLPENPLPVATSAPQEAVPVSAELAPGIVLPKKVPLPPLAPPISPADRLGLKGAAYTKAERCLANAIYFEARSEPARGQMAVAQVVLNRVFSGVYPNDICSVVYQNAHRRLACQFTFACDGKSKAITDRGSWARAMRIARQTLDGQIYLPEVGKSTHYHATYVRPIWAREMHRLVRYGVHNFYRPYAWGRGDEQPIWGTAAIAQQVRMKQVAASTTR